MNKFFRYKVFSGALQFTLFIGVLIALLLAGLVLLTYSHSFFILQSESAVQNIQLSNTAINYLLENAPKSRDTITLEELTFDNQKVQIQHSPWGIYDKGIVKTTNRKKVFYKSAFLGTQFDSQDRLAIYLQENFKPLTLVGNTIIKGTAFLPDQGVRPGNIAGESYYGQNLIQGLIKRSNASLPKLEKNFRKNLELIGVVFQIAKQEDYLSDNQLLKYTNSFLKQTKVFKSDEVIVLDNIQLIGNIIIQSNKEIKVKNTTQLKDIILIAPIIELEDKVEGNFQLIANKSIKIGKECNLNYPSALVLIQDKKRSSDSEINPFENQIYIDQKTQIKGTICYFESIKEDNFKTQIILNEQATITGEVYCEGNFELAGILSGTVYTYQFVSNKAGSIFINHIYNGQIISEDLPSSFCGLLFEQEKKGVAKWLY